MKPNTAAYIYAGIQNGTINATDYYGKFVVYNAPNYKPEKDTGKWRIYHVDGNNIYITTNYFVPYKFWPKSRNGIAPQAGALEYNGYFAEIMRTGSYTGALSTTDSRVKSWLSYSGVSGQRNMKGTEYLLDNSVWAPNFLNSSVADYAVGAPTIDLFAASYKVTHPNKYIVFRKNNTGYEFKWNNELDSKYSTVVSGLPVDTGNLALLYYNPSAYSGFQISQQWFASPGYQKTSNNKVLDYMMTSITYDGKVGVSYPGKLTGDANANFESYNKNAAVRVVVRLKSNVAIEEDGSIKVVSNPGTVANNVIITKYRRGTTTPVVGATIALCDKNGTIYTINSKQVKLVTNSNGQVDFAKEYNIKPGTYYYKEIQAPAGFKLDGGIYSFTVNSNGTVTYNNANGKIYNDKITATAGTDATKVVKYKTGTTTALSGTKFGLYDANKNLITTLTTGTDGKVDFASGGKLEAGGTYYYKETEAPAGYRITDSNYKQITVDNNGNVTFPNGKTIYNTKITATAGTDATKVVKYRTGTTTALQGAKFGLYDANKNLITTLTTGTDGKVDFASGGKLEAGTTYYYKETEAPAGYKITDSNYKQIKVDNNGNVSFPNGKTMYNDKIIAKGGTEATKVVKYKTGTTTALSGTKFGLYNSNKQLLETLTTGADGKVDFAASGKLEAGTVYYYKEIEAPAGYKITDSNYKQITVDNNGNVSFPNGKTIYNAKIIATAGTEATKVVKYRTGTTTALSGVKFGLYDANKNLILTLTTGADGKVDFASGGKLEAGETYYYKEIQASAGYKITDDSFKQIKVDNNGNVTFPNGKTIYNVKITATAGTDATKVVKYKTGTTTALSGTKFGLYNSSKQLLETLTTGADGKVDFAASGKLEAGTVYYYKEIEAPAGYRITDSNYKQITVDNNGNVTFPNGKIVYNTKITATAGTDATKVVKYKTETTTVLQGAKFGLYDANKNLITTLTTGTDGKVDLASGGKLEAGETYYYKEIEAPAGYKITDDSFKQIKVDNNGSVTFLNGKIMYNDKIIAKGGTEATKVVKYRTGTTTVLQGAKFGLYDANKNLITTLTTGADGKVDFAASGKLEAGTTYYYKEIEAPAGYRITDSNYKQITVDNNGNVTFPNGKIVYNAKIIVTAGTEATKVVKYRTGTTTALQGAKFGLYDANKNLITTLTTGADGKVDFASGGKLEAGTVYYYKEIEAPAGYIIADSNYKQITVDNNGNVTFPNGKIMYNDKIIATAGTEATKVVKYRTGTTTVLQGAKFGLYDANKNLITTLTTGADGKVDFAASGKLEAGTIYYYKEIEAPAGYIITDSNYKQIKVDNNGNVTFPNGKTIYNTKIIATAGTETTKVVKYRTGTTIALQGAKFGLYDANKNLITTLTTGADGKVDFASGGKLEAGEIYYYKEIEAPVGYKITDDSFKQIIVDNNGSVSFQDGNKIYNDKIIAASGQTTGKVTKYRIGTEIKLQGAVIGIYKADKTTKIGELITNENGEVDVAATGKLEAGETYYYKEIQSPPGYIMADSSFKKISVDNTGKITLPDGNKLYNNKIIAGVGQETGKVTKYRTGTEIKLQGAVIGIYKADKTTKIGELTTNENGEVDLAALGNLEAGETYYYKEIQAPPGYIITDSSFKEINVDNIGKITLPDGNKLYNNKIIAGAGQATGKVTKYRIGTEIKLQGAVIGIYKADKITKIGELITDENGEVDVAALGNLEAGETYYYKEIQAPPGYIMADSSFKEIRIDNTGKITLPDGNKIYNNKIIAEPGQATGKVTKYRTGTETRLQGAVIVIYKADKTTKISELVTDENGEVDLAILGNLEAGETYYYKEIQAPPGYIIGDSSFKEINVDNTGKITLPDDNILYNDRVIANAGTVIIIKKDSNTNNVIANAEIGLCDISGNILTNSEGEEIKYLTDENGQIDFSSKVQLEPGTYYYKEVSAPAGYVLNEEIYEFIIDNEGNVEFTDEDLNVLYNEKIIATGGTDRTKITKYRTGTETRLQGAVIGIYKADKETKIEELVTDENGEVDVAETGKLEAGETYYYKEIQAPPGYIITDSSFKEIRVDINGNVSFPDGNKLYNDKIIAGEGQATGKVTKYRTGTEIKLQGAVIGIYKADKLTKIGELITDENGEVDLASLGKLEAGETYYYKEIQAPPGYIITDSSFKEINVDNTGKITLPDGNKLYNNKMIAGAGQATGKVTKYRTGTEIKLQSAVIGIYKEDKTTKIGELTTNENGEVDLAALGNLEAGETYYYKEIQAPPGFIMADSSFKEIRIDNTGKITLPDGNKIYNNKIIAEPGQETGKVTKYRTGTEIKLQGAVIGIYKEDKTTKIGELITDENGEVDLASLGKLEAGETYYYKEIQAPPGYIITDSSFKEINVDNTGKITLPDGNSLYNDRVIAKAGTVIIIKKDSNTNNVIANAEIGLCDINGNILINSEGEEIKYLTDENGQIDFSSKVQLEPGTYHYKEVSAPAGYVLNEKIYEFIIDNEGNVEFTDEDLNVLYNEKIIATGGTDSTKIIKYRTGTEIRLQGAVIEIYKADKETKIEELVTDENGEVDVAATGKLEAGETYYYKEIQAPPGYIIADNNFKEIRVDINGNVGFLDGNKLYNDKIIAGEGQETGKVTKYRTGTEIKLQGAVIGIYKADKETKIGELITDENGEVDLAALGNLEAGETYYYKEIEAPLGYIIADNNFKEINVDNTGKITLPDGNKLYNDRVIVENGKAIIIKKDSKTNKVIANAEIGLCDINGNILINSEGEEIKYLTDENGQVDFSSKVQLEPGIYHYKEVSAPAGYLLNEKIYEFIVDNEGNVEFTGENLNVLYNKKIIAKGGTDSTKIIKYRTGTEIRLQGAVIGIYKADKETKIEELITDENGEVDVAATGKLEAGETYYYKEIQAPPGYIIADNNFKEIRIDNEGNVSFPDGNKLYNDKIIAGEGQETGKVTKYRTGTEIKLQGAVIGIYKADKETKIGELTTNENGEVDLAALGNLEAGETYYYKEVQAPPGYKIADNIFKEIRIDNTGKIILPDGNTLYNDRVIAGIGKVVIRKYLIDTQIPLRGAEIGLCDENGNVFLTSDNKKISLVTDEYGQVDFSSIVELEPGRYYYREIKEPKGYKLNTNIYSFVINENAEIIYENNTNGIIYDEGNVEYKILIKKLEKLTQVPIQNIEFIIYNIQNETGRIKVITNEEGIAGAQIAGEIPNKSQIYVLQELNRDDYKPINEIKIMVSIGETGDVQKVEQITNNTAVKDIKIEDGNVFIVIENEKIEKPTPEVNKPEEKTTSVPEVNKPEEKTTPVPEVNKPEEKITPVPEVNKPEEKVLAIIPYTGRETITIVIPMALVVITNIIILFFKKKK